MKDLNILRQEIDAVDDQIVDLIFKRFQIANQIGILKLGNGMPAVDRSREGEIISRLQEKSKTLSINPDLISSIFRSILSEVVVKHNTLTQQSGTTR